MRLLLLGFLFSLTSIASADVNGRIITDLGTITIRIYDMGELSSNFALLAKGRKKFFALDGKKVQKPFYDGLTFHRVHPDLGVFSGCPFGNGHGWPGYMIPIEKDFLKKSQFNRPGLIAMAKIPGDDRIGSQFFITTKENRRLDGKYPVFGEVISGMDIVTKIAKAERDVTMKPKKAIRIKQIEIDGY